jgi:hypothetical protein
MEGGVLYLKCCFNSFCYYTTSIKSIIIQKRECRKMKTKPQRTKPQRKKNFLWIRVGPRSLGTILNSCFLGSYIFNVGRILIFSRISTFFEYIYIYLTSVPSTVYRFTWFTLPGLPGLPSLPGLPGFTRVYSTKFTRFTGLPDRTRH